MIVSRDISLAYTNSFAYKYYSFVWIAYFNLFQEIDVLKTTKDKLALYCYFQLRSWKKLLFAQAPRYGISAFIIGYFIAQRGTNFQSYHTTFFQDATLLLMTFFVLLFVISIIQFLVALMIYFPLLINIRGIFV